MARERGRTRHQEACDRRTAGPRKYVELPLPPCGAWLERLPNVLLKARGRLPQGSRRMQSRSLLCGPQ